MQSAKALARRLSRPRDDIILPRSRAESQPATGPRYAV